MDIFAKKKQAEALRADIKQYIQFRLRPVGLARISLERSAKPKKTAYRKAASEKAIIVA